MSALRRAVVDRKAMTRERAEAQALLKADVAKKVRQSYDRARWQPGRCGGQWH